MGMTIHRIKSWPEFFEPVRTGVKSFELRKNDRDYCVGDHLTLLEWEPDTFSHNEAGRYTGRELTKKIVYVMNGAGNVGTIQPLKGLSSGYAILGLGEPELP